MKSQAWKFIIGIAIILAGLGYFAFQGIEQGKAYYVTVAEYHEMADGARGKPLKVAGTVADGSIRRDEEGRLSFDLIEDDQAVRILYTGLSPVPDTFKDGSLAVVQGRCTREGVFEADRIQAKCASKYEAKYEDEARAAAASPR